MLQKYEKKGIVASGKTAGKGADMSKSPTERFSDRVDDYVRYRPHYPGELIPLLRTEIGLSASWTIADIGSGTGFSAELFLENGNTVFGVEPNDGMRGAAEQLLAAHSHFHSLNGTAETTGLPAASIDLIIAGQAFHWFDPVKSREEFQRILKPHGWIALFWNSRRTDASPFLRGYEDLLLRHGTDYQQVRHDKTTAKLPAFFAGRELRQRRLPYEQTLNFEGLRGRLLSSSYTPAEGSPAREEMTADLKELFERYAVNGVVKMEYHTEIWVGNLGERH
jgi:SAM-dependent methyltransferase